MNTARLLFLRPALVAALLSFGAILGTLPVQAATSPATPTVTVEEPWVAASPLGLVSYRVDVVNNGPEFSGSVILSPGSTSTFAAPAQSYRFSVHIAGGSNQIQSQIITVSAPSQPMHADLLDSSGRPVASTSTPAFSSLIVVGVLSDGRASVDLQHFSDPQIQVAPFDASHPVPSSAIDLSGLNAMVISNYDVSTLSQAQLQALEGYVGFGGNLILTGGDDWRKTVLGLPAAILPLHPSATLTSSMQALASLAAGQSNLQAPIAGGIIRFGRVAIADGSGHPLVVIGTYGAGRITQLTYDPEEDPLHSSSLEPLAWSQAISRLQSRPGSSPDYTSFFAGTNTNGAPQFSAALNQTPTVPLPSIATLLAMLAFYLAALLVVTLVVSLSKSTRPLFWPIAMGLLVTTCLGALWQGIEWKSSNYYLDQIQFVQSAPDSSLRVISYQTIYTGHRGSHVIEMPGTQGVIADWLGTSENNSYPPTDSVDYTSGANLTQESTGIWMNRNSESFYTLEGSLNLSAQLRVANGQLIGQVINQTPYTLGSLYVSGDTEVFQIPGPIAPGSTVPVAINWSSPGLGRSTPPPNTSESTIQIMDSLFVPPGQLLLTAQIPAMPTLKVDGIMPKSNISTFLYVPVSLITSDDLTLNGFKSQLVSSVMQTQSQWQNVYEIPTGSSSFPAALQINPSSQTAFGIDPPENLAVYNWKTSRWQNFSTLLPMVLSSAYTSGGMILARVFEIAPYSYNISLGPVAS